MGEGGGHYSSPSSLEARLRRSKRQSNGECGVNKSVCCVRASDQGAAGGYCGINPAEKEFPTSAPRESSTLLLKPPQVSLGSETCKYLIFLKYKTFIFCT